MMSGEPQTITTRAVHATRIPSGEIFEIPAQTEVIVTQALGGSFTVLIPSHAGLFRVEGRDADAIGKDAPEELETPSESGLEGAVWAQLKTCYDPEIPVNIVDLGLIYSLEVKPGEPGARVEAKMTLTAPGCGMGPIIAAEARDKILALDGVAEATVDVVWEPAWSPDRISEDGKRKLGIL